MSTSNKRSYDDAVRRGETRGSSWRPPKREQMSDNDLTRKLRRKGQLPARQCIYHGQIRENRSTREARARRDARRAAAKEIEKAIQEREEHKKKVAAAVAAEAELCRLREDALKSVKVKQNTANSKK